MATYLIKNVPQNVTLEDFRGKANKGKGFAKSSRFLVYIRQTQNFLSGASKAGMVTSTAGALGDIKGDLALLAEATELPMRGFVSADLRYYGPNFKVPYQSQYEDLNVTFLCRNDFYEREFFDTWMQFINPVNTFDFSYRKDYVTTIDLIQYSDVQGDIMDANGTTPMQHAIYKFTFDEAYPVLVAAQPVTWADDNFHRLTVTFTYKRWYREEIDNIKNTNYTLVSGATIENNGGSLPFVSPKDLPSQRHTGGK